MSLELQSPTFLRVPLPLITLRSIYPQIWEESPKSVWQMAEVAGFFAPNCNNGTSRWANPPCSRSWHASPAHRGEAMRIELGDPKRWWLGTWLRRRRWWLPLTGDEKTKRWVGLKNSGKFWLKYARFFGIWNFRGFFSVNSMKMKRSWDGCL